MRIYLDACCLNRPFDDQTQPRIRIESEAVLITLELCRRSVHDWIISEVLEDEMGRTPQQDRREGMFALLGLGCERIRLTPDAITRARAYNRVGIRPMDALHLAAAEIGRCDVLLTTDDDFFRRAGRMRPRSGVRVQNPASWVAEVTQT